MQLRFAGWRQFAGIHLGRSQAFGQAVGNGHDRPAIGNALVEFTGQRRTDHQFDADLAPAFLDQAQDRHLGGIGALGRYQQGEQPAVGQAPDLVFVIELQADLVEQLLRPREIEFAPGALRIGGEQG